METRQAQPHTGPAEDDVTHIGNVMGRMRLMIGRRMIGRLAIAKVAPGLELSHLDVLDVIGRIDGEVTIGAVAEAMKVDPSRGSRMVADMVSRGVLRREVSQADARRSIIVRTPLGDELVAGIRQVKLDVLSDVLSGWPPEDVSAFARLFDRFIDDLNRRLTSEKPCGQEPPSV